MGETKVTADELLSGQIRYRQGGDANDFSVSGTTNYAENRKDMMRQIGVVDASSTAPIVVTFPVAFSNTPFVQLTIVGTAAGTPQVTALSSTGVTIKATNLVGALMGGVQIFWTAEGRR